MTLFWHRRDLRLADNRGLTAAAEDGPVCGAFVLDDDVLAHAGPPRVAFLLSALDALREAYRERDGALLVRRGDPGAVLPDLAAARGADRVVWNRDYSGLATERDDRVREALATADVEVETYHDAVFHEPGSITTTEGDPYAVFSYYWRKWRDREKPAPLAAPDPADLATPATTPLPALADLDVDPPEATLPPAGPGVARERLRSFCADDLGRYAETRDYPAADATSRLSVHLKFGTLGIRTVYEATEGTLAAAREGRGGGADVPPAGGDDEDSQAAGADVEAGVEAFREQLAWREFYVQVLDAHPHTVAQNYRSFERPIEWREDPEGLQAWTDGETGYPLVDAGMRQLREEAWMHNRVRMVVASFLTRDLLVDWREGYDWFREKLVDHDPASDAGGWQWAAGTGTDAQPYFRVFNPATQCERYDPDGAYVRRYVPALREAPVEAIHEWPDLAVEERREVAPDYPDPIVDHATRREAAIAAFERARGDESE